MQVLPIASGKGGVGKSLFASNVAIALAQAGKKVVLADLDLGASNLHLILGTGSIKDGIGTFLCNSEINFNDIIFKTEYNNLQFIPGDGEIPGMANLTNEQKTKLYASFTFWKLIILSLILEPEAVLTLLIFFSVHQWG